MKQSHQIALLQSEFTTVKVNFLEGYTYGQPPSGKLYTYKTRDKFIKVDDVCVVEANGSLKLVKVKEVDQFADIDLGSEKNYKWIIQRVDLEAHNAVVEAEKKVGVLLTHVARLKQRNAVVEEVKVLFPEGSEELAELNALFHTLGIKPLEGAPAQIADSTGYRQTAQDRAENGEAAA